MRGRPDAPRAIAALGLLCATIALWAVVRTAGPDGLANESTADRADAGIVGELMPSDVLDGRPNPSSVECFLDDLEDDGVGSVGWTVAGDLVEPVEGILEAYRDAGGASLVASGYLDLKGNLWGAVVRGDDEWVDVVVVSAAEDAGETRVRVARLHADEQGGRDEAMG